MSRFEIADGHRPTLRSRGTSARVPLNQESLHALSGIDLARVDIAFRVGGHHVKPVKTAAGVAEESEVAERLAVRAVYDPHDVIHDIRDVDEARVRSREGQAAGRPAIQGFGRDGEFPHERSIPAKDLHAIRAAIGGIN